MSYTRIVHTTKPVVGVTTNDPLYWRAVEPGSHGLWRTVRVDEAIPVDRGGLGKKVTPGTGAMLRFDDTEIVPGLGIATLEGKFYTPIPDMDIDDWTFTTSAYWRTVKSEVTRQAWLKCGTSNYQVAVSDEGWQLDPGILLRMRLYAVPSTITKPAYVAIGFVNADDDNLFELFIPRSQSGEAATQPNAGYGRSEPCVSWSGSPTTLFYGGSVQQPGAVDLTPGTDIAWRIRYLDGHLVVTGSGLYSPWIVRAPAGLYTEPLSGRLQLRTYGGMLLYHVAQVVYAHTGTVEEAYPYVGPSHTVSAGDNTEGALQGTVLPGTGISAYSSLGQVEATLTGSNAVSPRLVGLSEYRYPTLVDSVDDEVELSGVTGVDVDLNYEGRGQSAAIWFHDRDRSITSQIQLGSIVTVTGCWDGGTPATLFVGRATDPLEWQRREGDIRPDPQIRLVDEQQLLDKKLAGPIGMWGSWSGVEFGTAVTRILLACGIPSSRIDSGSDDTQVLRPQSPGDLEFTPSTSAVRMLDVLCAARGWTWRITRLGQFVFGAPPTYSSTAFTLADATVTEAGHISEITHRRLLGSDYANSVMVVGWKATDWLDVEVLSTPGDVGHDLWAYEEGEFDNPVLRAVQTYNDRRQHEQVVSWTWPWLDFDNLIEPRTYGAIGTIDGVNLDGGERLLVRECRWRIDCEAGTAHGEYTATVEPI